MTTGFVGGGDGGSGGYSEITLDRSEVVGGGANRVAVVVVVAVVDVGAGTTPATGDVDDTSCTFHSGTTGVGATGDAGGRGA